MESSTTSISYGDWRRAVDERLQRIYYITIEDAGFDEEYLVKHWQANEAAFEFVEWFGNKCDLDPVTTLILPRERNK
jgi:hypothetical protein